MFVVGLCVVDSRAAGWWVVAGCNARTDSKNKKFAQDGVSFILHAPMTKNREKTARGPPGIAARRRNKLAMMGEKKTHTHGHATPATPPKRNSTAAPTFSYVFDNFSKSDVLFLWRCLYLARRKTLGTKLEPNAPQKIFKNH